MGLRDLLCVPKINRRTRSEARSDIGPIEGQSEAVPVVPRPSESTPDLGIGVSTSPTSSPLTSRDQETNGNQTASSQMVHLTIFCVTEHSISGRFQSVFSKRQGKSLGSPNNTVQPSTINEAKSNLKSLASSTAKVFLRGVKESADAFPPLKSVAGGLCFILDNCEVWSTSRALPDPRCSQSS